MLSQGLDLGEPLLGGDHAEKAQRLVADVFELVLFVLRDIDDVSGFDLVDLPSQENSRPAFQNHDSLVVEVMFKGRLTAGGDLEVANGKVLRLSLIHI